MNKLTIDQILDDRIKHLEPSLREELKLKYEFLSKDIDNSNLIKLIREETGISKLKSGTSVTSIKFFEARGWGSKSLDKVREFNSKRSYDNSPFKLEYWIRKGLTVEEAEWEIRSRKPFNNEYWINKGFTLDEAKVKVSNLQQAHSNKGNKNHFKGRMPTQKEYWLNRNLSVDEATEKVKERQDCTSYKRFVKIHGFPQGIHHKIDKFVDEDIKILYSTALENSSTLAEFENNIQLLKSKRRGHASKASMRIFNPLFEVLKCDYDINVGAHGKKELKLFLPNNKNFYRYDFCIENVKAIIEYDGIIYHTLNNQHDANKTLLATKNGYSLLRINEADDLTTNVKKIINFLKMHKIVIQSQYIPNKFQKFLKAVKNYEHSESN